MMKYWLNIVLKQAPIGLSRLLSYLLFPVVLATTSINPRIIAEALVLSALAQTVDLGILARLYYQEPSERTVKPYNLFQLISMSYGIYSLAALAGFRFAHLSVFAPAAIGACVYSNIKQLEAYGKNRKLATILLMFLILGLRCLSLIQLQTFSLWSENVMIHSAILVVAVVIVIHDICSSMNGSYIIINSIVGGVYSWIERSLGGRSNDESVAAFNVLLQMLLPAVTIQNLILIRKSPRFIKRFDLVTDLYVFGPFLFIALVYYCIFLRQSGMQVILLSIWVAMWTLLSSRVLFYTLKQKMGHIALVSNISALLFYMVLIMFAPRFVSYLMLPTIVFGVLLLMSSKDWVAVLSNSSPRRQ
jgi:hypothetical protein